MGVRLIDQNLEIGKVVVVISNAEDWESIKTSLNDELFVDWIKYVVPVVIPRNVGEMGRRAFVEKALSFCKNESRIQFILPSKVNGRLDQLLPFAAWVKTRFDEELGSAIDSRTVGYTAPKKVVEKIIESLSKYKFEYLDSQIVTALSIPQTMRIKPWLAQWADISTEMREIGEQVLRNLWYVKMPPLLDRIRSAWIDVSKLNENFCPTVVFFEEDSHDSNTALIDGLLNRYESVLGKELKVLWVSKQWTYEVYAKPSHRRSKSSDLSLLYATELVLVDECNISGHKAYGKSSNFASASQLGKMKLLADKIYQASGKSCNYRLWYAYTTDTALRYIENTTKFDVNFVDPRFLGIGASLEQDFLRDVSQASPMAFNGMTDDQVTKAIEFAEKFPVVSAAILEGKISSLRDWKGGYLTTFFLPASKPADNYPPLIHQAKWLTLTESTKCGRQLWKPLFARSSGVATSTE